MNHISSLGRTRVGAWPLAIALLVTLVGAPRVHGHAGGLAAPSERALSSAHLPCTVTVESDDRTVDGERDGIAPGAVVCLAPGTRPNLKIINVVGTAEAPITIRNDGGTVRITGTDFEAGLYVQASSHLRITGSGVVRQCGAQFESDEQQCGIVVDGARKGVKVATARGDAGDLEFDHLAIVRVSTGTETRGIAIHPVDGQVVADIRIHHNHVTNTLAEAVYIGSEPRQKAWDELGKVDRVEVAYNLIENIGWDAIKMKVALSSSRIHHNVIRNVGLANYAAHRGGITLAMSRAVVDHNVILNSPEGIRAGRAQEGSANRYHDNIIVDTTLGAIQVKEDGAQIYNNTIVRAASFGIRARGAGTAVHRNIVVDAREAIDIRRSTAAAHNFVASAAEIDFVDSGIADYRLTDDQAAILAAADEGPVACRPGAKTSARFRAGVSTVPTWGTCRTDIGARVAADVVLSFPAGYTPITVRDSRVIRPAAS